MSLSNIGTRVYISLSKPATEDITGYAALTWTEIGGLSSWPATGTKSETLSQPDLADGFNRKAHGAKDGGGGTAQCRVIEADAGQQACETAADTEADVSFKVVRKTGRIEYSYGIINGVTTNESSTNNVYGLSIDFGISSKTVKDDSGL